MIGAPSNTRRSGEPHDRSTIDRSKNDPAADVMPQPKPLSQQRACKSVKKRGTSLASSTGTTMATAGSRKYLAGFAVAQAATY
jgi:hypothetical protein